MTVRERRSPQFQAWGREAIIGGRKFQTRRVMKPQPECDGNALIWPDGLKVPGSTCDEHTRACGLEVLECLVRHAPHGQPGVVWSLGEGLKKINNIACYMDGTMAEDRREDSRHVDIAWPWKRDTLTSMYMPLWAARDFVTLKDVRVERLQDISRNDIIAEGVRDTRTLANEIVETYHEKWIELWDSMNAKPKPVKIKGVLDHYESFPWEDVQETREYRSKPWIVCGNPWVWAETFGDYVRNPGRKMTK